MNQNVLARIALLTKDHLTRHEAALYAGVSLPTIDRRIRDKTLPTVTTVTPKRVLIPRTALDLLVTPRVCTDARIHDKRRRRREIQHRESDPPRHS